MRPLVTFIVALLLTAGWAPALATEAVDAGLIAAIRAGDETGVRTALADGADVTAAEADGTTPLHWAVQADHATIVDLVLAAGADADVDFDFDVDAANRYGVRPLVLACTRGKAAIVKRLLEAGADANATLAEGETALI